MACRAWIRRLAFLASVGVVASSAAQTALELVTVLQRVPANYRDAGALSVALDHAAAAQTRVARTEGMSNVISRLYGVGRSNAPEAYSRIRDSIQTLNGLGDKEDLRSGQTLLVPDIPRMALATPDPANPYNAIPKLSLDFRPSGNFKGVIKASALHVEDSLRAGAQAVIQMRRVRVEEAKATLARDPDALVSQARLHPTFLGGTGPGGTTPILPPKQAVSISAWVARPALQKPVLFIFDDAWPSLKEEEASRAYLLQAIAALRDAANYPPMIPFEAACALGAKVSSMPPAAAVPHAAQIAQALKPMIDVAGANSPVTVVYIPNLGIKPCAGEVLGQIIEWHLLKYQTQGLTSPNIPVATVQQLHAQAKSSVDGLQSADALAHADSDVEAIQAVLEFTRRHGDRLGQPVFTSMSWDFKNDDLDPKTPSEYGGLLVVAAGNSGQSPPVITTKRQFAEHSYHPGDMLAVMNVDDQGVFLCTSSLVDPDGNAFAAAFRGDLSFQDCGGTSFAAPRVAWLLALREAGRAKAKDMTNIASAIRAEFRAQGFSAITAGKAKPLTVDSLLRAGP